jgi:glycine hydroxymethyltransferase
VTHQENGAAGLYGVEIHEAAVDPEKYSVDLDQLRSQAQQLKPKLITIGGSLNLLSHPVSDIREIADEVGAYVLFDAAHQCGMIAGKHWPNPLDEGAHLMTFSTYKSLGGPPAGLIVSNDKDLMQKIDAIAFPGLTANFDVAKSAALAVTLLDWREFGVDYVKHMVATSKSLASALKTGGLPVFEVSHGDVALATDSHQFAVMSKEFGGGQAMARRLREVNILSCGIGLPVDAVEGDMNGLRLGTPEIVRTGMQEVHMNSVADFILDGLFRRRPSDQVADDVMNFRQQFQGVKFVCE